MRQPTYRDIGVVMVDKRVLIGKYNDNVSFGLRTSRPGIDALTDSSAGGDFTFDSEWTDITKTLQISSAVTDASGNVTIPYTNPGYIPFVEVRYVTGNRVHDDYAGGSRGSYGANMNIHTSDLQIVLCAVNATFLYIIYRIPVMSG